MLLSDLVWNEVNPTPVFLDRVLSRHVSQVIIPCAGTNWRAGAYRIVQWSHADGTRQYTARSYQSVHDRGYMMRGDLAPFEGWVDACAIAAFLTQMRDPSYPGGNDAA